MTPVSAMVLVRDDRHVLETIGDFAGHCAEVLVGWTPCEALSERELRAAGASRVIEIPGPLMDWAAARNRVMEFASQEYCTWGDSDDRVELGRLDEALSLLAGAPLARLLAPYWYRMTPDGKPSHVQLRERLWRNDGRFTWERRCHETLVAKDGRYGGADDRRPDGTWAEPRFDGIVWKHHRVDQPESLGHQLEMLRLEERDSPDDPWVHQNLGLTLYRMMRREECVPYLERVVRESGDVHDRAMTMLVLARAEADIAHNVRRTADFRKAEGWARQAVALMSDAFESHYVLGLILSMRAMVRSDRDCAAEALAEFRTARERPHMDHRLGVALSEREADVHMSESWALGALGDQAGALEAMDRYIANTDATATVRVARAQMAAGVELDAGRGIPDRASTDVYDIVLACGRSWAAWNPAIVDEMGFGGSETAVVEMARRLRARGHRVRVFCSCGGSGIYDGVEYRDIDHLPDGMQVDCDVLVAWRDARQLEFCDARVRVAWAHDVDLAHMTPRRALLADRVLALSEWHRGNLAKAHGLAADRVVVTSNGVDLGRFAPCGRCGGRGDDPEHAGPCGECGGPRDPHRVVYSSSLDRGLQVLLDVWPEIRARVPDASLHVFYGSATWEAVAHQSGNEQQRYAVQSLLRRLRTTDGVTYHGKVDQKTLAREMLASGVWVGSLWFPETSCISAMEAQAAGLRCVAAKKAAMEETVAERGSLIEGDWLTPGFQRALVDEVVFAATSAESAWSHGRDALQAYAREHFGWERVVEQWEALFAELLAENEAGRMPAYGGRR